MEDERWIEFLLVVVVVVVGGRMEWGLMVGVPSDVVAGITGAG